jgi:hypothetical protein
MRSLARSVPMIALASLALAVALPGQSSAFALRAPQVPFCGSSLQGWFTGAGQAINVATDQIDAQVWATNVSGNSAFTFMLELTGTALPELTGATGSNSIGIYNALAASPALYQIFASAATVGWYASAHFSTTGSLTVAVFDNASVFQGSTVYTGVDRLHFGFYLQGPGGTFYSQDVRNGGKAQMLAFAGTGVNTGNWWLAFEDQPFPAVVTPANCPDFDDVVLEMQSLNPTTPAHGTSWGAIKTLYRAAR